MVGLAMPEDSSGNTLTANNKMLVFLGASSGNAGADVYVTMWFKIDKETATGGINYMKIYGYYSVLKDNSG